MAPEGVILLFMESMANGIAGFEKAPMEGDMNKIRTAIASVAFGAGVLGCACGAAEAGSITQPGETAGIAIGAPVPEGAYFVNTLSDGGFRGVDDHQSDLFVTIPVLAYYGPKFWDNFQFFGYFAAPAVSFGVPTPQGVPPAPHAGRDYMDWYNPALLVGFVVDLGCNWGFSNVVGGYGPTDNELRFFAHNVWVFNERAAISYTGDKWNLTAHAILGLTSDDQGGAGGGKVFPDYLNVDLTAVKTLGKWEVGLVGFYSTDLSGTRLSNREQSQFALGPLIGYEFTGITAQLYYTRDVYSENYFNIDGSKSYESRVWSRVIIPLWNPPKEEETFKK